MQETRVVNLFKDSYDVYIGRAGKGHSGYYCNPIILEKGQPKGSTLPKFRAYFEDRLKNDPEYKRRVESLKGKVLGCFCDDVTKCHGGVYIEYLDKL